MPPFNAVDISCTEILSYGSIAWMGESQANQVNATNIGKAKFSICIGSGTNDWEYVFYGNSGTCMIAGNSIVLIYQLYISCKSINFYVAASRRFPATI